MNAAYGTYRQTGGFIRGAVAWFKCIAIASGVMAVLWAGMCLIAMAISPNPGHAMQSLTDKETWAFILGVPLVAMIYYLPWFVDLRVSRTGDGLVMGFFMNTLFGWFPVFWFIMLMLAIFKNR